jgi:hypothetical protein
MAVLICPRKGCRADFPDGANFCPEHHRELVEQAYPEAAEPAPVDEPVPVQETQPVQETAPAEVPGCWACDAPLGGPADVSCRDCARPIAPPPLYLRLASHVVALDFGEQVWLGRDRTTDHHRMFPDTRVSRRHALVGLENDGSAWILDENATNHTHVDGCRIEKNVRVPLTDGQRIEFVPGVEATVHLYIA